MTQQILTWESGAGWLVFSGGASEGSPIRAQALTRAAMDGDMVCISFADDGGESLFDDMEDLGAPSGYILDIENTDPQTLTEELYQASLIVIEVGTHLDAFYQAVQGVTLQALRTAYQRGAVVLIEGLATNVFGRWVVSDEGRILAGAQWVHNAFIEPDSDGVQTSRAVQAIMANNPDAIAINISVGSAIALGSHGRIELWGEKKVTLSIGKQYADPTDS